MGKQYRIDELIHYGIKGQKWGVRRYQNKNGSLTPAGKERYNQDTSKNKEHRTEPQSKYNNSLKEYDQEPLTNDVIDKYKSQYRNLNRVRIDENTKGRLYVENGKVVGMVNTEKKNDGTIWIQGVEVFGDHKGKGIGTGLLDVAVKELGATHLSVRKTNKNAKRLYDKYGFNTYEEDDYMYYMNYDKIKHNEEVGDFIAHYGIKGQKWGVRRYQNKDGSLTPAGKERYGSEENFEVQYPAEQKAVLTGSKKAVDGAKEINRVNREMYNERTRKQQKIADKAVEKAVRERARNMSDRELREAVNRLNMEENYTRMMQNRERIDMGESKASKFMDHTATALTVTSTALSIALAIKELKK